MVASDSKHPTRAPQGPRDCLSPGELAARLEEEVSRATRHGTALSCLLVSIDDVEDLAREHGEALPKQALSYLGAALGHQLRRFDRIGKPSDGELLVVLPGADEQRAEIVARRALGRLHAVKIEVEGERRPLRISVGIAAWREGLTGERLISQTRLAARLGGALNQSQAEPSLQSQTGPPPPGADTGEMPALRRS